MQLTLQSFCLVVVVQTFFLYNIKSSLFCYQISRNQREKQTCIVCFTSIIIFTITSFTSGRTLWTEFCHEIHLNNLQRKHCSWSSSNSGRFRLFSVLFKFINLRETWKLKNINKRPLLSSFVRHFREAKHFKINKFWDLKFRAVFENRVFEAPFKGASSTF